MQRKKQSAWSTRAFELLCVLTVATATLAHAGTIIGNQQPVTIAPPQGTPPAIDGHWYDPITDPIIGWVCGMAGDLPKWCPTQPKIVIPPWCTDASHHHTRLVRAGHPPGER
jgi:hypothetical protein